MAVPELALDKIEIGDLVHPHTGVIYDKCRFRYLFFIADKALAEVSEDTVIRGKQCGIDVKTEIWMRIFRLRGWFKD